MSCELMFDGILQIEHSVDAAAIAAIATPKLLLVDLSICLLSIPPTLLS